jgi:curli biogenesis system outer membrane secretion channel CsgG
MPARDRLMHSATPLATLTLLMAAWALPSAALAQTGSGGKDGQIEKCDRILGTLAVSEPQSHMLASLNQYKLGSPATMLRMIAQESACFTVVERGVGMQNIQQERALASGGMLQQNANVGGGQLQAADFVMTPSMQFADTTGGVGGVVGGLFGKMGGALGALGGLAGGLKFKEAETTLLLADVRSGIQVASAEGKASKMDFSLGGWGWGGFGWASAGGYSKTPEGKLIAASLLDNYNRIVQQVRNKPTLVQASSAASAANAQASTQATPLAAAVPASLVVIQPAPVLVQQAAAPMPAPVAQNGGPDPFMKVAGIYSGLLSGPSPGKFSLMLAGDGSLSGWIQPDSRSPVIVNGFLSSMNGDFNMGGRDATDNAMLMGRLDLNQMTIQGQWVLSKSTGGGSPTVGTFNGKR